MEPAEIILAILGGVGGTSVIVVGLSGWLGKVWAARIGETEKHARAKDIEVLKAQLELEKQGNRRNADAQFTLYIEVWKHLQSVKIRGDRLWEQASRDNLESFLIALLNARVAMEEGRLILAGAHYQQLRTLLSDFDNYYIGKAKLIDLRSADVRNAVFSQMSEREIGHQIQQNAQHRDQYQGLLDDIAIDFKKQLNLDA